MHVYNLWYSRSLELDRYTAELQREQKVFEDLIQQKAYIVLPELAQVGVEMMLPHSLQAIWYGLVIGKRSLQQHVSLRTAIFDSR